MAEDLQTQITNLATLSRAQLRAISQDFRHPPAVQAEARNLLARLSDAELVAAVVDFAAATRVFTDLTKRFVDLTALARTTPGGDAVATLSPIVRQLGDVFEAVTGVERDHLPAAGSDEGQDGAAPPSAALPGAAPPSAAPPGAATGAPPPGTVSTSRKLSDIAGEYVRMFDAAVADPAKATSIDRLATVLASFRSTYEKLQADLGIPWHFIGLIHCMESSFNFGTHLHNGDSLMHRTVNVPKLRPPAEVADPPFAWTTSATDALTMKGFHTQTDWSLAAQLFRLEQYNGFGYRMRGRASPYLWSFSDRYTGGKFVRDGVFDPAATSKQCGTAVLLKRLIARGDVTRP
jgi:lysozyme family protein